MFVCSVHTLLLARATSVSSDAMLSARKYINSLQDFDQIAIKLPKNYTRLFLLLINIGYCTCQTVAMATWAVNH